MDYLYWWGFVGVAFHLVSKFFPLGNHSKSWTPLKKRIAVKGAILAVLGYTICYFGIKEGFAGFFTVDIPLGRFSVCLLGFVGSSMMQHWTAKLISE
jgi:hypothetical protein